MSELLERRARGARNRAALRAWEYRQRRHAKGVWFRLRRVLMNAEAAYAVSEKEARRLLDEGLLPEPVGGDLEPPKTLIFINRESLKEIEGRRKIPISLGHEFLEARWLVLVKQG